MSKYGAQLMVLGGGLGLLVPSLTSTLLDSVEKSRSGIAAGVLNATRQTGSVLGVALFGSLVGENNAFMTGAHVRGGHLANAIVQDRGKAQFWCPGKESYAITDTTNRCLSLVWWRERLATVAEVHPVVGAASSDGRGARLARLGPAPGRA